MDGDRSLRLCSELERDAARVLKSAGLTALIKQVRERFEAGTTQADQGGSFPPDAAHARRRWGGCLRTLYLAQKNLEAYLALAEETGLTATDCDALASMLAARRKAQDALAWVERGLELARQAPNGTIAG